MTTRWITPAAALAVAALAGCADRREVAPVRGTVTYKGKPVVTGMVMFAPAAGPPATGKIGPDGQFRMTTYAPDDGAVLGPHTVTVSAYEEMAADRPLDANNLPKPLVPEKYSGQRTSGLTAEVTAGDNVVDLPLK